MREIKNVCVYCGSSIGADPRHTAAARALGVALARAGVGLVYGGGAIGLMGVLAKATVAAGGVVTGIIPEFLDRREIPFTGATELVVVDDMHTRKRMMFERSDAFIALPGGIGTLEELTEQLTWIQLGRHTKPLVIADIGGFWRPLLSLLAHMRNEEFFGVVGNVRYLVAERVEEILPMIFAAVRHSPDISETAVTERL
ncbi:MAG: TIGR00730 family Rossman fold protein [Methylocystis silviterrae]